MSEGATTVCNACGCTIASYSDRMTHYKTEWHRYNIKRRCADMPPISREAFEEKLVALQMEKRVAAATFKCETCGKSFTSAASYRQHMSSRKHSKKERRESERSSGVDQTEDGQQPVEIVEENAAAEEQSAAPIPVGDCLFCPQSFGSMEPCLEHMLKEHGFFVPFMEKLVDMEGLLAYLGEKVAIGCMCLYCNGRGRIAFPSMYSARQHMNAKHHCKLRLESEEDMDEFLDFYDFEEAKEDEVHEEDMASAPATQAEAGEEDEARVVDEDEEPQQGEKRRVTGISSIGELVLSDGAIIGHRSLVPFYRQKLKPRGDEELIFRLVREYRERQLPTYAERAKREDMCMKLATRQFQKHRAQLGVKANKLQRHLRKQVMV